MDATGRHPYIARRLRSSRHAVPVLVYLGDDMLDLAGGTTHHGSSAERAAELPRAYTFPLAGRGECAPQTIVIGRDPDADVSIPLPALSRRHAIAVFREHHLSIADASSKNGTWLNGHRLEPRQQVRVEDFAHVSLGGAPFLLVTAWRRARV